MTPTQKRSLAAGLVMSVAGFTTLMNSESFVATASRPVPGDRCTKGYGSTFNLDGSPVKCGEKITEPEARKLMVVKVNNVYQAAIHKCAGDIEMYQGEFDALVDLADNLGGRAVCSYSIIDLFRAGKYAEGCKTIFTIDKLGGRHCNTPENRNRTDGCKGIMNRRQTQYDTCMSR